MQRRLAPGQFFTIPFQPCMSTEGYTLVNAWVVLTIIDDSAPASDLRAECHLEGDAGLGFSQLRTVALPQGYTGPRVYRFNVLQDPDVVAGVVRVRVQLIHDDNGVPVRMLTAKASLRMVAGLRL